MLLNGETPRELTPLNYVEGHAPTAPDEVSVTKSTAEKGDFTLGDTVRISADGPARSFRLVGIAKFGDEDTLAGAMLAVVQVPVAQEMLDQRGEFDEIAVVADPGVSDEALSARVRAALPAQLYTVRTGEEQARSQASDLQDQLSFLRTFLFAFAGIALFVGAFLIVNTYSITVAQRMREFALLRMIGASRRQVLRAVLGEAFVVGLAAAVIGLGFGVLVAFGLRGLFSAFGAELPTAGLPVEPRTVIVSLLIGTVVTVLSAAGPALRATRVPPIAALQDAASLTRGRTGRLRTPLSIGVAVIGVVLICLGLFGGGSGGQAAALIGAGAAVVFVGVGLLASHIVRPLALIVGKPLEKVVRRQRPAGARELGARAAPHRLDRVGADDRRDAGRLRGDLRRGPEGVDRRGRQQRAEGRPRRAERDLPAGADRARRERSRRCRASASSRRSASASARSSAATRCRSPASTRRPSRTSSRSAGRTAPTSC